MKRIALSALVLSAILAGCGASSSDLRTSGIREFQVGNNQKARDFFQQSLDRDPSDAACYYYLGRIAHADGFYEKAIWYYQCSIDHDPSHPEVHKWLDKAQAEAPQVGKALQFIPDQPRVAMPS